jgi:hypothetical protein
LKKSISLILVVLSLASCGGGGGSDSSTAQPPTVDTSAPVLSAPESISVAAQSSAGISASESAIADFLNAVVATDNVDSSVSVTNDAPAVFPLGLTSVTFSASDRAGNEALQVTATVTVLDADAPVISLNGASSIDHVYGLAYTDLGAVAEDSVDGSVTVTSQGAVDVNAMGRYELVYSAVDSEGNVALPVTRTVTVTTSIVANSIEPYISEYSEGSANNRYIEIYNDSDSALALAGYAFAISLNGADIEGVWDVWNDFDISASVEANSVYSLCDAGSDDRIKAQCDMLVENLPDGNDGFALVKGSVINYAVLDRVGSWSSSAPANGWDVCGYSGATTDRTLVKKPFIRGSAEWSASAGSNAENCSWLVLVEDDWTNLGAHSSNENPDFISTFKLMDSRVTLQDYNPADQTIDIDEFEGVVENGAINVDLQSAPLNLLNLTNAVDAGDFQDATLTFALDSALPSAEASALVDLYITTGIDGIKESNESQLHCQLALNWQSNGATASIVEPAQDITLVVTKPSLTATTTIGAFDVFEVSSDGLNNTPVLELKLMTAINEAVKVAPELLMSLLVPRRLHVRVVFTLPLIDSQGAEITELNAIMRLRNAG